MPSKKSVMLHTRHSTKAEVTARLESEAAMHPDRGIPSTEPAVIKKNKVASATWRRVIREYDRLDAKLVSRLDIDLLIDYCIVMAQIDELDHMRSHSYDVWHFLCEQRAKFIAEGNSIEAIALVDKIQKAYEVIIKMDARVDSKRKLVFSYRQSLFMTPRSRTGVTPAEDPEKKGPEDPFEKKLNANLKAALKKIDGGSGDLE